MLHWVLEAAQLLTKGSLLRDVGNCLISGAAMSGGHPPGPTFQKLFVPPRVIYLASSLWPMNPGGATGRRSSSRAGVGALEQRENAVPGRCPCPAPGR